MEINNIFTDNEHEEIIFHQDKKSGLKTIVAIHNTTLGPAVGGVRIHPYKSVTSALDDALLLSRAMTYKSAVAGLPFGGGKAVIIADPYTEKTEELLLSYGYFIDSLGGKYITTIDVGSSLSDIEVILNTTSFVCGLPAYMGGSGETEMTGLGIYMGMKACANELWGNDSLSQKKIVVQGFGKVGTELTSYLLKEGADIKVFDVNNSALKSASDMGLCTFDGNEFDIFDVECDILSPCALGGVINERTIPKLKARAIVGGANNQLEKPYEDGKRLHRKGILYAPDYVVNAGGVINVSSEIMGKYNYESAKSLIEGIYDTMGEIIEMSKEYNCTPVLIADKMAESKFRK